MKFKKVLSFKVAHRNVSAGGGRAGRAGATQQRTRRRTGGDGGARSGRS